MDLNKAVLNTPAFAQYVKKSGFAAPDGSLNEDSWMRSYPGEIRLTDDYIARSGGLLRAVSRKAAEILRADLNELQLHSYPLEILDDWKYILMHSHPHLDEYFAAYMLRASLPEDMHALAVEETALFSCTDDRQAQEKWPHAAVLGVGNVVNGGAEALLLFDEHEAAGEEKTVSSLAMMMKRHVFDRQQPPFALYQMLRETNYIDQYGAGQPKSIAGYIKYMHNVPLAVLGEEFMDAEWKSAIIDACLAAFYVALRNPSSQSKNRRGWENCLRASLEDFAARTPLRRRGDFDPVFRKVKNFMIDNFAYRASKGALKYTVPSAQNPSGGSSAEMIMLVPYLPQLCFRLWGGALTQLLLYPLWECRVYSEMMNAGGYKALKRLVPGGYGELDHRKTDIGVLTVRNCGCVNGWGDVYSIIELDPTAGIRGPAPLNQFIRTDLDGCGFSIFRNRDTGTIVLGKGEGVPTDLWERVCDRLTEMEGLSDDPQNCGAWHVTRNPSGIAPFLLNGNPTHRYVPRSAITAEMLAGIVDECMEYR